MSNHLELKASDLILDFEELPQFKTTAEVTPYKNIIGQARAVKSIDIGLLMDKREYNIYVSGPSGTGKTSYIINKIEEYAKSLPDPLDWCYVYNFKDKLRPLAISLPTGTALTFKEDIAMLINELFNKVPTVFDNKNYENAKKKVVEKYEKLLLQFSKELHEKASQKNFTIDYDGNGNSVFIPLHQGEKMNIDTYNNLSAEEKVKIDEDSNELKILSYDILKKITTVNKLLLNELKNLDNKLSKDIISKQIKDLKNKYVENMKVIAYLDMLEADVLQNINAFLPDKEEESSSKDDKKTSNTNKDNLQGKSSKKFFKRYDVKILITNEKGRGAPVIYEDSAIYSRMFGNIEFENSEGSTISDFTMIRAGTLHLANGGFFIANAEQLLGNATSWKSLKKFLKSKAISVQSSKNNIELSSATLLTPEAIPLKVKIILVGTSYTYSLLSQNDYDFNKLFKIKSEFDSKIENEKNNIKNTLGLINNYINENNFLHITRDGVKEILKHSCRLADNRNYFTAYINKLLEVIDVANTLAKRENSLLIDKSHIVNSIEEIQLMHELAKKRVLQMYQCGKYIIDLSGSKIAQINGLSIMNFGDSVVGQQHRITATTFTGKRGVTNIERAINMSGNIHSKGIMILSGFIGEFIGQNTALSFSANIVFEQLYSGIEGDSASAAELLALISSLSDIPIKQSLAITGSINQKGEIQPIGGVNDKIEGYFDICNIFNMDGSHGVVIPNTNVDDLVLKHNVINAVEKGLFHIYPVKTIKDCVDILFDFQGIDTENLSHMAFIKQRILSKLGKYRSLLKK